MLTLFTLGKPITMLGDHMQLPPVCEIDREELLAGINLENEHRYDFLWDLSALYVDHFFDESMENITQMYINSKDPDFPYTSYLPLTMTFRFGPNLAKALGKHVYLQDVQSHSTKQLEVDIINATIDQFPVEYGKVRRKNVSEAQAVIDYINNNEMLDTNFVVLAPYKDQVNCIKKMSPSIANHVLTIHKSQGREWDTVIISVCDCAANPEDKPPRFTSTLYDDNGATPGIKVMNTAISRAKKKLVLVCDEKYWSGLSGELLRDLIVGDES
jgi:hypothetical protein